MKRADLKVGQEYLVHDSNDWATGTAWSKPERVTVLDTGFWHHNRYGYGYGQKKTAKHTLADGTVVTTAASISRAVDGTEGKHVLVRTSAGKVTVVLAQAIRGPWAETKATYDDAVAAVERRREEKRAKQDAAVAEAAALRDRLLAVVGEGQPGGGTITIRANQLRDLLDRADA